MFYLLSVSHDMQCADGSNNDVISKFKDYLRTAHIDNDIDCIAEEFNLDAADDCNCTEICCLAVAKELNIGHVFFDPDRKEREELGITDITSLRQQKFFNNWTDKEFEEKLAQQIEIREQFWLDTIWEQCSDYDNILLVIGEDHEESFSELLDDNEEDYEILSYPGEEKQCE